MLDKYIKELIASNNRVIIPNFGAFLLRATSKNKNKKELSAKIDDIYFSPFLKFNDELLVNHIIKKEDATQKGAMDKIAEYIKTIESTVKDKGAYKIEGMGEFYMDSQGKIQFKIQSSTQKEEPKEQKPPPAAGTTKKETPKASPTVNEKAAQKKSPTAKAKPEGPEKSKTEKKETPVSQAKTEKSPEKEKAAAKTPPPPPSGKKSVEKEKSGSKGNKGLILSIAIGVPVAVLFIWAMLNFDTIQNLITKDKPQVPVTENMEEETDEQKPDEQDVQEQTASKQTDEQETSQSPRVTESEQRSSSDQQQIRQASGDQKYYVVAGSFKNRQNAVNFHRKLLDEGYDSEMIGERNGMHAVSYASFSNKNRAQSELQRLRNEKGLQAWLLYY